MAEGRGVMFYLSEIDGSVLPSWYEGICLGYWWRGDLLASRAVEENIQKARKSFFHFGRIQWSSQVIDIGRAPAVRLTVALTTLVLAHTYRYMSRTNFGWARARPGTAFTTPLEGLWSG